MNTSYPEFFFSDPNKGKATNHSSMYHFHNKARMEYTDRSISTVNKKEKKELKVAFKKI